VAGKELGQHFLMDPAVARRIAEAAALKPSDTVLEVGPGRGALTGELLPLAGRVIAVEIDRRLTRELRERFPHEPKLMIIEGDILEVDWGEFMPGPGEKLVVASNLPYQITSPFIFKMLGYRSGIERAILMVQREVGERIAAAPGCKDYGILSVVVQLYSRVDVLFRVGRGAFRPAPRVDSVVIRIDFSSSPGKLPEDEALFLDLVRSAFGQRRKMLRNSLLPGRLASRLGGALDSGLLEAAASSIGLKLDRRAETLSVEEFVELSDAVCRQING